MTQVMGRDLLRRYDGNPILTQKDMPFKCSTVFNGTPVKVGDEYLLLLRVEGQQGYSFFALARGSDGFEFTVDPEPCMLPAREAPWDIWEENGIEDPPLPRRWINDLDPGPEPPAGKELDRLPHEFGHRGRGEELGQGRIAAPRGVSPPTQLCPFLFTIQLSQDFLINNINII